MHIHPGSTSACQAIINDLRHKSKDWENSYVLIARDEFKTLTCKRDGPKIVVYVDVSLTDPTRSRASIDGRYLTDLDEMGEQATPSQVALLKAYKDWYDRRYRQPTPQEVRAERARADQDVKWALR